MVLLLAFGNCILEGWHFLCANFPALLNKKMFFHSSLQLFTVLSNGSYSGAVV
jgi:hypothetical protein